MALSPQTVADLKALRRERKARIQFLQGEIQTSEARTQALKGERDGLITKLAGMTADLPEVTD